MKRTLTTIILLLLFFQITISQNNSLDFDGNDDYVDLGNNVCNGMRSIELWFNSAVAIDNSLSNFISLAVRNDATQNDEMHLAFEFVNPNKGKIRFGSNNSSGTFIVHSNADSWNANQWYHVAGVFHPTNGIELYIDGVKQTDTNPHTGAPGTASEITALGVWGDFNDRHFNGKIDDVRFWDYARTQSEIQNDMNTELSGTEAGLISYYKMDIDNSTCDVEDCNSNENHGTRIGSGGSNNLPQFVNDTPSLTDVTCGVSISCSVLPVQIVKFNGRKKLKGIELIWTTSTEINNSGFEILKSKNGSEWETIAFVVGNGTTNEINEYLYQDLNPFSGINYYRLKQQDLNGVFEYSKTIVVDFDKSQRNINIYPNPSSGIINLQLDNPTNQKIKIQIFDITGRSIWENEIFESETYWKEELNIQKNGVYLFSVQIGNDIFYRRVIVTN